MAKMFYSTDEVQEKLGCTEDQIKDYVQNGQLREFRDGSKILFKVDEVDALSGSSAGADEIPEADLDLALDLDGSSIGLAGSSIGLASEDSFTADAAASGEESPLAGDEEEDLLAGSEAVNLDGSSIGLAPTESEAGYDLNDASSNESVSLEAQMAEDSKPAKDDTVVTTHGIDALEDNEA
ncbi:MAG: helix-turn-helix domain-containing protein, partial [Clostridia bacterium]|nr:helix-turn-helix domain-containing protein [Clostridia bacterium]